MTVTRAVQLVIGCGFLLIGIYVASQNAASLVDSSQTFAQEPIVISGFDERSVHEREPVRIIIPNQGIDVAVDTAHLVNGYWQVFEDKAGWGIGSGVPGEIGNQVIFAHAREGLFKSLENMKVGDSVYVLAESKESESSARTWYEYRAESMYEVYPSQTETIWSTPDEQLTLYTCTGFNDSKRLIVVAKPHRSF